MSNAAECPRSLVIERVFPHPQEKLWRALTESTLLAQWMMSNDFEPAVGKKFQFRSEPKPNWNGIVDCEVVLVDPIERLSYNWGTGGPDSGLQWVRMEQSGFGPDQMAAYNGANYGWHKMLGGLERVLEGANQS